MKDNTAHGASLKSFAENWLETGPVLGSLAGNEVQDSVKPTAVGKFAV